MNRQSLKGMSLKTFLCSACSSPSILSFFHSPLIAFLLNATPVHGSPCPISCPTSQLLSWKDFIYVLSFFPSPPRQLFVLEKCFNSSSSKIQQQSKRQQGSLPPPLATPVWAGTEGILLNHFLKGENMKTVATVTTTFDSIFII